MSLATILNAGDRFWERLMARYPRLRVIDSADWMTWIHHAFITIVLGQLIGWALPWVSGDFGMRLMVFVYLVREIVNVSDLRRLRRPLKPLDHVCDVLVPLVACELVARAF